MSGLFLKSLGTVTPLSVGLFVLSLVYPAVVLKTKAREPKNLPYWFTAVFVVVHLLIAGGRNGLRFSSKSESRATDRECPWRLTFVSATHCTPRNIRLFTEISAVADERQISDATPEYVRTPSEYRIVPCRRDNARRAEAEAFVRRRFLRSHGAHIATFMPTLLLLTDADSELAAVAGFRCAAHEPLFLERYLPVPIEQALTSQMGAHARRAEIVEVGNFAAIDPRRKGKQG